MSKNALKKLEKQKKAAEEKAAKAAAAAAKVSENCQIRGTPSRPYHADFLSDAQAAEAGPAKAKKASEDEELDPTKYFENR